jgi:hypothetical protein
MATNVDQHQAFHGGLVQYTEYLQDVSDGKKEYSGEELRRLIDSFMPALREHLADEIGTILALERYEDNVDLLTWFKGVFDQIMKKITDKDKVRPKPIVRTGRTAS